VITINMKRALIMKEIIKNKVSELFEELVAIRRYFHQHPELKFEEYETSKKIQQLLTEWGIENQVIAKTGVVGIIRGERPGKTIAIRADIDGLPIRRIHNFPLVQKMKEECMLVVMMVILQLLLVPQKFYRNFKKNYVEMLNLFFNQQKKCLVEQFT